MTPEVRTRLARAARIVRAYYIDPVPDDISKDVSREDAHLAILQLVKGVEALAAQDEALTTVEPETWPRVINDDGEFRLEQTQPPNSYLVVRRNRDNTEVVSTPCVITEPKDEIIRLLTGAWRKALRRPLPAPPDAPAKE